MVISCSEKLWAWSVPVHPREQKWDWHLMDKACVGHPTMSFGLLAYWGLVAWPGDWTGCGLGSKL